MSAESQVATLDRAPLPKKSGWFALGALLVAGAAIAFIGAGGLGKNLVYYWNPTQLTEAGAKAKGATIRLGGQVAAGTVEYEPGATELTFAVTDGERTVPVHTKGVPPQMFREGIGVVVEGTVNEAGKFEGSRLMVSHGNEYRAPKPGEKLDEAAMKRIIEDAKEQK
jgi:cytochrome c-type biogenesis protein CcmE